MQRRLLPGLVLAHVCVSLAPPAWALTPGPAGERALDRSQVRAWLVRVHEAAVRQNFEGTFVVSQGGAVTSVRIAHYCEGTNQFERIETLDGVLRRVYRHNEIVHTFWPQNRVAVIEQRDATLSFPSLVRGSEDRIADSYAVLAQEDERVAGQDATALAFVPRDKARFGYRLWSERRTGLLLRAEVIGLAGEVLESSAFSDVKIGIKGQRDTVLGPMTRLGGYRVLRPVQSPAELEREGWMLQPPVAGFQQVSCVKRPLDGAAEGAAPQQVLQSIYSDGLTHLSVFIERYDPSRPREPARKSLGATNSLAQARGAHWVTVVGDVPMATLTSFADALKQKI